MAEGPLSTSHSDETEYQFQLDVHIKKRRQKPLFYAFGKTIYDVEWIDRDGPFIVLLRIDGAKAIREASYYVNLSLHSHIVRTFGLVRSNPGSLMLLQECAPHGDLLDHLQDGMFKPTERVLWTIFQQICDGMIFLVGKGIVHGDLACRNVLVFQSNPTEPKKNLVKLTDFGLTQESSLYSIVPSPTHTIMTIIPIRYAAPELLRHTNPLKYSERSDVYSMGTLMWEACSYGELPYSSLDTDNDVLRRKLNDERLPRPSLCGDQLWTIINECWHQNPEERPDFRTLRQRIPSTSKDINEQENSAEIVECEYCHNRCSRNDYTMHKRNCLRNRSNTNNTSVAPYDNQRPIKKPNISKSIVRILCEYCYEPIEVPNISTHAQICSERQKKPVELNPKSTTNQKINELIPCEFCGKLCTAQELLTNEINCLRNPNNMVSKGNSGQRRPVRNTYDNNTNDDTAHLLPKNDNRPLRNRPPITQPDSETQSTGIQNGRKSRQLCCCC